jgi:transcriptional regulator with XRE-family HTH domain
VFAIWPMDLKRTMATNVRRERYARELTQEELADRAGLSARYLGSIERGAVSATSQSWEDLLERCALTRAN